MNDSPSEKVILQRIRNRIIEVLELFSDEKVYDMAISNLEFWADWVGSHSISNFGPPVFSPEEVEEIRKIDAAWEHVDLNSGIRSEQWAALSQSSRRALTVFMQRGKMSEKVENT
ncbi:hypothetical protein ACJJIG_17665 [Microbulbifer sp. SSSA007]|uniref:hypothetical protein n=1 Tax=Microbulbifer sp. SSSA007 TaxID=3243379 RepID=UPI00403A2F1D